MASVRKHPDGRWRVRYYDEANKQREKRFATRREAQDWLDKYTADVVTGSHVPADRGKVLMSEWAEIWFRGQTHLKESSAARTRGILDHHVIPHWGKRQLADVRHEDVQAWVTALTVTPANLKKKRTATPDDATVVRFLAPASVLKIFRPLDQMLRFAVKADRLRANPADEVNLPRAVAAEQRFLTHSLLFALADEAGAIPVNKYQRAADVANGVVYRVLTLFLGYTGVRYGEAAALSIGRVDFLRRQARIHPSVTDVNGKLVWGVPKNSKPRDVPIPEFLLTELAALCEGRGPDDLLFTGSRTGDVLRENVYRRAAFDRAAAAIGIPDLHPHELRHTAASLAISVGANIKVVQNMLGHRSATVTWDTYGHLYDNDLSDVAQRLNDAANRHRKIEHGRDEGAGS